MIGKPVGTLVIGVLLATSGVTPVAAQRAQIPAPTQPPQVQPPVQPTQPTRPTYPGGPQVQPPRPTYPGGPQVQPPRPTYPGGPAVQPPRPTYPGGNYGQTLRCESRNNRRQQCSANTENRVQLVRRLGGTCTQGRSWGYTKRMIWVDRGCRAEFAYGRWAGGGGGYPQPDKDKGPSTGAIIAGVVVAGGLLALLASSGSKKNDSQASTAPPSSGQGTFPAGPPATLSADLSPLPSASRASVQLCLNEAARQIGATGGTRLSYDRLVSLEPGNGGWRFGASLTATYPDGNRTLPLYCRATPTQIIQLDFANS